MDNKNNAGEKRKNLLGSIILLLFQSSVFYMHGNWFFFMLVLLFLIPKLTIVAFFPNINSLCIWELSLFSSLNSSQQPSSLKVVSLTYL